MLDAHLHVVDPDRTVADTTGNPTGSWWHVVDARVDAVLERLAAAGVEGGVFVQAVGAHGLDDNEVALEAAAAHPGFAAMVTVDPSGPDPLAALAESAAAGATGLRLFSVPTPGVGWLDSDLGIRLARAGTDLGMTPSVCCLPAELGRVDALLAATGESEIALDHGGFVAVGGDDSALVELARHRHLVLKLSTGVFDHSALDPARTVDRLVEIVGPDRLAWGSDHPQVHDRRYPDLVALADRATAHLPDAQRAAILEGTTARLWCR